MTDEPQIKKLTPYQHLRLRTTMYLGSTTLHTQNVLDCSGDKPQIREVSWVPAVYTCLREIIENSLDEVVAHSSGDRIDISYDPEKMCFSVRDNGRGIPIDWDPAHNMHKVTLALSELMSGRNFEERNNTAGMNGIGASGVNYCSTWFRVEIHRDNQKFTQEFREGNEMFGDSLQITTPEITRKKSTKTGTLIEFQLSPTVFRDMTLPMEFVKSRIKEIASANPEVKFVFNNQHIPGVGSAEKQLFSNNKVITIPVDNPDHGFVSKFLLVPDFCETGDHAHSMVNNIPVFNGGNHVESFKKYFVANLLNALAKESKRRGISPNRSDVLEGLLIYNTTVMRKPDFDSQSKTRLINEEVEPVIRAALDNEKLFKRILKDNSEWIEQIFNRCAARTQRKDDVETAKLARKLIRNKVPKLIDATGKDRTRCILGIFEGDSAVASLSQCRNPEIHGGLPLRGKILNVRGETNKTVLDNAILQDIMSSLGLILGQRADRSQLRYGKVWIGTDQDHDGANIMALLLNFFHSYWPELFDSKQEPFFYAFSTPFIIQEDKQKTRHYWYADDVHLYNPKDWRGCPTPTRAKGLGSLEEIDWANSLANPRLIPLVDDSKLSETLELLFEQKKADDRKAWMAI
jgi:DNA gyrase/topoisomerase IV subunit B